MVDHNEHRVVVGVSGSLGNLQALRAAVRAARRTGAVLCPVTAWAPPGGEFFAPSPVPQALLLDWVRGVATRQQEAFNQALGGYPADLELAPQLVRGDPGPVLVAVADRVNDLLVIGTGRPGLRHLLMHRSVSRYCLRHADCPLLVVPPPPLVRDARHLLHLARTLSDVVQTRDGVAGA